MDGSGYPQNLTEPDISFNMGRADLMACLSELRACGYPVEHHPLGFLRLHLTNPDRLKPGYYLHTWPVNELEKQDASADIHNHIFDLDSQVLVGSLVNIEYDVEDDDTDGFILVSVKYSESRSNRIRLKRQVGLSVMNEREYSAGDTYSITKGIFHQTLITQKPTCTLMRKSNVSGHLDPINVAPIDNCGGASEFDHSIASQSKAWDTIFSVVSTMQT